MIFVLAIAVAVSRLFVCFPQVRVFNCTMSSLVELAPVLRMASHSPSAQFKLNLSLLLLQSSSSVTMAMSQDSSFKLKVVGDDGRRHTAVDTHKDASKENMFNALSKLDKDGDGAFRVEDLMRVMEDQQKMLKTVRSQRYALVAFTVVIILLFGVNLASSVLSLSLMKDMSVQFC